MQEQNEEILNLCRENNKILKGMRRHNRWASFFNFLYYAFIVGSIIGAYYYVQPLINSALGSVGGIMDSFGGMKQGLPSAGSLNISPDQINQIKKSLNL